VITGGKGDDILTGGEGADTYNYSAGDGNDTINLSNDGETDTLSLKDISKEQISLTKSGKDLQVNFSDLMGSLNLPNYFDDQFNDTDFIIDANDEFQMQLSRNSAKMAEIIAGMASDDDDGGSVNGNSQITTQVDASALADL